jgi:hypothetical protein
MAENNILELEPIPELDRMIKGQIPNLYSKMDLINKEMNENRNPIIFPLSPVKTAEELKEIFGIVNKNDNNTSKK